jgi:hypothetical protein
VGPLEGFWAQSGLSKIYFWAESGPYWTSDRRLPTFPAPICKNTTLERDGHEVVSSNLRFHLVDGFYSVSPDDRFDRRLDWGVPLAPSAPVFRPNLFTADWGLPPKPFRIRPQKLQS